jgi:hypothetical protein
MAMAAATHLDRRRRAGSGASRGGKVAKATTLDNPIRDRGEFVRHPLNTYPGAL